MAKGYAKIPRSLWDDDRFRGLSSAGKVLYFTLRAGPPSNSCGLCRVTVHGLAGDLDWSPVEAQEALTEIEASGLVEYDHASRLVIVPDVVSDYPPANPNGVESWVRMVEQFRPSALKGKWLALAAAAIRPLWHAPLQRLSEHLQNERDRWPVPVHAGEVDRLPDEDNLFTDDELPTVAKPQPNGAANRIAMTAAAAMEVWCSVTGQQLRSVAHRKFARGRLSEGFNLEELRLVVQWAFDGPRREFFAGRNDRRIVYLRPKTLWSATNFEGYLRDAVRWRDGDDIEGETGDDTVSAAEDDARVNDMHERLDERTGGEPVPVLDLPEFE